LCNPKNRRIVSKESGEWYQSIAAGMGTATLSLIVPIKSLFLP